MVYISIESRKGGVGKTTTALTLAEVLLGEGYQVLMIDLDIVGTTIDSSFINSKGGILHEVKFNGEAVNLVRLFKEVYMVGKNIPAFTLEIENTGAAFSFVPGKCNFIGSNIYDKPDETTPLEDPRVLYDAFHAFWLLELVKGISRSFEVAVGRDVKVAVILDNSPGFSSIENSIHDYLTDLGPEMGKVLLVSSIDHQDLEACRQSKNILETLFGDKVAAGDYYRSMIERGEGKKKKSQAFKSVWNSLCVSNGHQPAYFSRAHEGNLPFVTLLANKVPQSIFEQLFAKDLLHRDSEFASPFQNHLLFYYSDHQLSANEITHRQSYTDRFTQYAQSGKVTDVELDDTHFLEFCHFSRQIGLGDFFKEDWGAMARFKELLEILKGQEALKEPPEWSINLVKGEFENKENRIADEVRVVERFVLSNISGGERIKEAIPAIVEHVKSVLESMEGKEEIDFHPEHPKLQEIESFVTSFGLATYRLHIYEQVCRMLNSLMTFCLTDIESAEKLNKESIGNWVMNVLEGRVVNSNIEEELLRMLDDRRNARELGRALQLIIKTWGL